uniref:ATP synthase complex subunit 8 n=1 Tax=Polypterus retropinnis TaxID=27688 RepID=F2W4R2_9ACTI|nr:ATP synthase F0 subunit 8 [Polypterus retropinnis]ADG95300.1 ATP synthase F0 subunit 8 [Polypterus retropinnis]
MPQLNPDPWFIILIFTWTVFLSILPNKVTSHKTPNETSAKDPSNFLTEIWSWPWH